MSRNRDIVSRLSADYDLPEDLLVSVLWNENRMRWLWHQAGDEGKLLIGGNPSLGLAQVQLATAAFLDTECDVNSLRGVTTKQFEDIKRSTLESHPSRSALARRLLDPEKNLEYAAAYLSFIRDVTGDDPYADEGAKRILANYNRGPGEWRCTKNNVTLKPSTT